MKKKLFLSVIVFLFFVLVAELGARLLECNVSKYAPASASQGGSEIDTRTGWQSRFFESIFGWHESDQDLLWRFRANLNNRYIRTNSRHLIGEEVSEEKAPCIQRILLLGDSSPVGLGLDSYRLGFGVLLRQSLEARPGSESKVELISTSVSGYSSEQIARYLDVDGWRYDPDLVIIYCGSNDASVSGMFSDRELLSKQRLKLLRRMASRLAVYRVLKAVLTGMIGRSGEADGDEQSLKVRVTPERFGENLNRIADQCWQHGCPLIIIKPPVPVFWPAGLQFKVFSSVHDDDGQFILPVAMRTILGREVRYCLSRERFDNLYGDGDIFTRGVYASAFADTIPPRVTVPYYITCVKQNPDDPVLNNNLGVAYWENGHYREADRYLRLARDLFVRSICGKEGPAVQAAGSVFLYNIGINMLSGAGHEPNLLDSDSAKAFLYLDSALQADYLSLRIKRAYLDRIDALAERPDVFIVDLPLVFAQNGDERLFIDHCHPTEEGHRLIAQQIQEVIVTESLLDR